MNQADSGRPWTSLVTVLAPMTWGSTYIVTTELLPPGRPLFAAAARALPAGLILLMGTWLMGTRTLPHGWWWVKAVVLGVLNIGGFFALLFVAAFRLPGGLAATLNSTQPLIAAGIAAVVLSEPFHRRTVIAGFLGIVGVGLLTLQTSETSDAVGVVAGLGGAASMAFGVVLTKRWATNIALLPLAAWQLIVGGSFLGLLTLVIEGPVPELSTPNVVGIAWLCLPGTVIAYSLWFWGVARLPVVHVSHLGTLSPVVASILGFVILGQSFERLQLVGIALILSGVMFGTRQPRSRAAWGLSAFLSER